MSLALGHGPNTHFAWTLDTHLRCHPVVTVTTDDLIRSGPEAHSAVFVLFLLSLFTSSDYCTTNTHIGEAPNVSLVEVVTEDWRVDWTECTTLTEPVSFCCCLSSLFDYSRPASLYSVFRLKLYFRTLYNYLLERTVVL